MDDKEDPKKRILEEEDFIKSPKFANSLTRFVNRNSDGAETHTIAKVLMITEEEVESKYQEAVEILRNEMVDED